MSFGNMQTQRPEQMQHELDAIAKTLDLSPEAIETTAHTALYHGLCKIRHASRNNPDLAHSIADAMHNLPIALANKDYELIREYTIEAVHAQTREETT